MNTLNNSMAAEFLDGCSGQVANIETGLAAIQKGGMKIDEEQLNKVLAAVRSVRVAGFFNLVKIAELAQGMEEVLGHMRPGEMIPSPNRLRVLRRSSATLRELIENAPGSNQADIGEVMSALSRLLADHMASLGQRSGASDRVQPASKTLRTLLAEDDFASRLLLQTFLSRYGECHVAVNGKEAVQAFRIALEAGQRYNLICMDIMMPEMDGREAIREIRALEQAQGIFSSDGAKIIMTTSVREIKEVIGCFQELCDAYLMKPIDLGQLLSHLKAYRLVG